MKPVVVGRRAYDLMYRWWAPWDATGVRADLRALVEDGEVTPATHPRAVDLGCGTGANAVFLAARGFDVTAIDFSSVALAKAEARAQAAGVGGRCRFLEADLTRSTWPADAEGPFDLLVDASTLDDLAPEGRATLAGHIARIARPGATLLFWCFYAARDELPLVSFVGPSRLTPGLEPGEEDALFGAAFDITLLSRPHKHEACFRLQRRADDPDGAPAGG